MSLGHSRRPASDRRTDISRPSVCSIPRACWRLQLLSSSSARSSGYRCPMRCFTQQSSAVVSASMSILTSSRERQAGQTCPKSSVSSDCHWGETRAHVAGCLAEFLDYCRMGLIDPDLVAYIPVGSRCPTCRRVLTSIRRSQQSLAIGHTSGGIDRSPPQHKQRDSRSKRPQQPQWWISLSM